MGEIEEHQYTKVEWKIKRKGEQKKKLCFEIDKQL